MDNDSPDFEDSTMRRGKKRKGSNVLPETGGTDESNEFLGSQAEEITIAAPKRTYLITYSRADKTLFPTRKDFGQACEDAFGG